VTPLDLVLVTAVLLFAWSLGAHYTGACMGMPYGSGSIRLWPALVVMAVLAFAGAALASHRVEITVGLHLVDAHRVTVAGAVVIILVAFALTTLYNAVRVPTSTIQVLVFSVAGVAWGAGIPIHWATILKLAVVWVLAPPLAAGLGFLLTRGLDHVVRDRPPAPADRTGAAGTSVRPTFWATLLVLVGAAASFTMGANDVSNATGALVMTRLFNVWTAGILGGLGLLVGVLTWGRPLLETVAFDIVHVDLAMASAAQFVQGAVVFAAVVFGFFTSMNQALVGAMTGAGMARGQGTVAWPVVRNILTGWAAGPPAGLVLGCLAARLVGHWIPL
jgi:PiT family inorganic phosphate transporter